ncbi:sugar ABC transporter ATP-binding protein [Clostridium lacusfryxellense]|uniref:sugar ABC transporter ATP-binding protein n=1 Tax=Clostridium lacusfryxellense TaxID=205328 RepID=UPI001C0DB7FE|nr:sugar ABC transporter ATP-binding protein [Clostridium lacusfryxellense]MBU3114737.1 sugar ABC transporter ATP-binding protein [Clostridium lacusfryxellense]
MGEIIVSMEGIEKSFPGVHALNQCKFELRAGEVHALIGENGAGKSTMVKIMTGVYRKDAGKIIYKGVEVDFQGPKEAQELGISIVHQELNLMPHLTIAQNIFIGRETIDGTKFLLNDKVINDKTQALFDRMHLNLDPRTKVSDISVAKQQMVEIARALSFKSEVVIMDEPTAALTEAEIDELFRMIYELRDSGVGIVYISHRMEELKKICDRITVMRDGCYIDTVNIKDVTIDQIIHMMVGRTIYETAKPCTEGCSTEVVLEVKDLNRGRMVKNISFNLKKGEILGFAGLMGSGRTEVARAIFGADAIETGEIFIKGNKVLIKSPGDAVKHGIGYLSEDRKQYGLTVGMDVESNIVLSTFNKFTGHFGWVNVSKTKAIAEKMVKDLRIKTPSISQKVKFLSGGNQQKVVIGKWLTRDSDILIFDEPTRGIDIGAKSEIYKLLNDLAAQGKSIIMISSELPEIMRMSHRIMVMCGGRITGELSAEEATQNLIMKYATKRESQTTI